MTLIKDGLLKEHFAGTPALPTLVFSTLIINICALVVPLVTLQVYDRILSFHSNDTLNVLLFGAVIIVVLDIALKLSRSAMIGWSAASFEHTAYTKILHQLMKTKLGAIKRYSHGETIQRMSAVAKLKSFYSGQSLISLIDLPFVLIFLGFIGYLSGALVFVPLILLALFVVYALYLAKTMESAWHLRDHDNDRRINFLSEVLENVHTTKMLGLENALQRRYEALQGQNIADTYTLNQQNAYGLNAASLFTQIMMVAMISIGALLVIDGQITMGVLIACVLLSGRIMQPVQRALSFWVSFQDYRLAQDKINDLMALPIIEKEILGMDSSPKGKLEIKNLSFAPFFNNIDLTLKPGRTIALVGNAGDDKTALMKLITGLYEPGQGSINIDGLEASSIPNARIAEYVGYLPSEADILQGTIMENLTSFRPELESQAREIAGYLGIDKVVLKLASGYKTKLNDSPADPVTPGMKQRITIARVLVNRPRILLFDFADKSLDKEGYNHLFRLLGQIKGQASMILASNDRNILHLAHDEYVIEDGRLVPNEEHYDKSGDIDRPLKEFDA